MLNWLKHFQTRFKSTHSNQTHDVFISLNQLLLEHSLIDVQFQGGFEKYQSIILDIDFDNQGFTIDALFPELPPDIIRRGTQLYITNRQTGNRVFFNCYVRRSAFYRGSACYQLEFPEFINHSKRRTNHRINTHQLHNIFLHLSNEQGDYLPARVLDMSSGGLSFETVDCKQQWLADDTIQGSYVELNQQAQVYCNLLLKHHKQWTDDTGLLHCEYGAAFQKISAEEQERLNLFILKTEQSQRRYAAAIA